MLTRKGRLVATGLSVLLLGAVAAGCATGTTATPASPPASSSAPAAPPTTESPTTPEPTTPEPTAPDTFNLPVGATVTVTDNDSGASWDVTLNSVRRTSPGPYDEQPPAGQHYIVIDVTYSVKTGPVDINEWDWTARDETGLSSEVQMVSSPNDLSATTLQTGSKIRGTVVLLSNSSNPRGTIVYTAGLSENASWQFKA